MRPKNYQDKALYWLRRYYERCHALGEAGDRFPVSTAFTSVTAEVLNGTGLPYADVPQVPGIPYVCLRLPTGGGKTFVGCEAIAVACEELLRTDHALVLWLVPSEAIREQTLTRLQDRADPYRVAIETRLGAVEVLDIDEARSIQRSTLDAATVIIVATMQAFRRKDTTDLLVYRNNGQLMSHFENLHAELLAVLERQPEGHFYQSLVNVFRLRRPFVIVDEAHNSRQPLSFETLRRLNPAGILELTATPNIKRETVRWEDELVENPPSNVLFSVSAYALKAEHMIKLPLYLSYREPWDALLGDALGLLDRLQTEADQEKALTGEYIRPIMLLQAQPDYTNRPSINVEMVKRALREQFHIPDEQIAVATGTERGLDRVDVLSPACKLRFIITVAALKEGWDCPFAYVLFSVAELTGARGVEQILGRVLRMPNALRKRREALNTSYACVASINFAQTARALKDGLVQSGFEKQEVDDLVVCRGLALGFEGHADGGRSLAPVSVTLQTAPASPLPLSVLGAVTWDEPGKTLTLEQPLSPKQEAALVLFAKTPDDQTRVRDACAKRAGRPAGSEAPSLSPAQRGAEFVVPVLALKQGELFHQLEEDDLLERMEWSLSECDVDLPGFVIPDERRGIVIDISEKEKLQQDFIPVNDRQLQLLHVSAAMSVGQLVNWLDRSFVHQDLTDAETGIYLTRLVGTLMDRGGFSAEQLTAHRYRLAKAAAEKIGQLRQGAKKRVLEELLFADASQTVFVTAASVFRFDPNSYPYANRYDGLPFHNHYYEVVGELDNKGEEYDCARLIDSLDAVEFWVRNLEREPEASFWIQTASDRFYPDFVCKLRLGKILVIEYKGGRDATSDDTKEKERLGQLWAERSGGTCLFLMIRTPQELGRIAEAVR